MNWGTALVVLGSVLGGAGTTLMAVWAVYVHKVGRKEDRIAAAQRTREKLADLQLDQKIHAIVANAVTKAAEPLQAAIHENTKLTRATKDQVQAIDTRLIRVETVQFGGNGGGFREKLDKVSDKVDGLVTDVAVLKRAGAA